MSNERREDIHLWATVVIAMIGALGALSYVIGAEVIPMFRDPCAVHKHGIPWGTAMMVFACILPLTVGPKNTVKVFGTVGDMVMRVRRRRSTQVIPPEV